MAWTTPRTWTTGELVTASIMNSAVRDDLAYLKDSPTFDGVITVSGFGVHTFSASGTGTNRVQIDNPTSGAANTASLRLSAGTSNTFLFSYSQGYTTAGAEVASGGLLLTTTAGGLSIQASAGTVRVYGTSTLAATFAAGSVTVAVPLESTGNFTVNTNKFTVAAASGNTLVAGTLSVTGDVAVNTNKFTVTAATGNTVIAGTLNVTGTTTVSQVTCTANTVLLESILSMTTQALGGTSEGCSVRIGANSSGSGAAGYLRMADKSGNFNYLWVDAVGKLRISATAAPTANGSVSDTSGTIVGTQL